MSISGRSSLRARSSLGSGMPQRQAREQGEAVIRACAPVLVPPALDHGTVDAGDVGPIEGHFAQPFAQRDAEAFLAARQDLAGEAAGHGLLQDVFALAVAELEA